MGGGRNAHSDRQLVVAFTSADSGLAFIYSRQSGLHGQPSRHPHSIIVPFV